MDRGAWSASFRDLIDKHQQTFDDRAALNISSWSVADEAYHAWTGRLDHWEPTRAQMQAVTRAMRSFVRKHQRYALGAGKGRAHLILYQPDDVRSVTMLRLTMANGFTSLSDVDAALRKADRGEISLPPI